MSTLSLSIERRLIRKVGGREISVDITNCFWCGTKDFICAVCTARADNAVASSQPGYDEWTTDALQDYSATLYEQYLNGDDCLDDLHLIAEVLRSRSSTLSSQEPR